MLEPDSARHSDTEAMGRDDQPAGAPAQEQVPNLWWRPGVEVPPFISSNSIAVQLCEGILLSTVVEFPPIVVSEAVAVQIYRLVFDAQRRASSLKHATWADLYRILASLARRELVAAPTKVAWKNLHSLLARKAKGSHPPGLDGALRQRVKARRREPEPLCSMSADEATDYLLCEWDKVPLHFPDFDVASAQTAGGGGDPDGGDTGVGEADASAPPPPAVSRTWTYGRRRLIVRSARVLARSSRPRGCAAHPLPGLRCAGRSRP